MANNWDQFELLLREFISPAVVDLQLSDDDPLWRLMGTFEPVAVGGRREVIDTTASDVIPAGFEARFRIRVQSGGRVAGGTFGGNVTAMMGADSHLAMGQGLDAQYLDPQETPLPSHIPINMVLKRGIGSVTLNHQQILTDLGTDPIDEVASNATEDGTRRLRSYLLNGLYCSTDVPAAIARVNHSGGYTIGESTPVAVVVDHGTFARFEMGDLLVAATPGADPAANPHVQKAGAIKGYMRVVNVDPRDRIFWLQSQLGEGDITLADNDILLYAESYDFTASTADAGSMQITSFESLIRDSGIFPGSKTVKHASGLNVANHAVLRGFNETKSPQVNPTMEQFTQLLDLMLDAQGMPSVLIGERSIWTLMSHLDSESTKVVQVPMGTTFQGAGGVTGPVLTHNEQRFIRFSSKRIAPNTVYGINPEDWMRYIPLGDRTINWLLANGPLAGMGTIFRMVTSGARATELAEAPYDFYSEIGCKVPQRGLVVAGFNAQRDV